MNVKMVRKILLVGIMCGSLGMYAEGEVYEPRGDGGGHEGGDPHTVPGTEPGERQPLSGGGGTPRPGSSGEPRTLIPEEITPVLVQPALFRGSSVDYLVEQMRGTQTGQNRSIAMLTATYATVLGADLDATTLDNIIQATKRVLSDVNEGINTGRLLEPFTSMSGSFTPEKAEVEELLNAIIGHAAVKRVMMNSDTLSRDIQSYQQDYEKNPGKASLDTILKAQQDFDQIAALKKTEAVAKSLKAGRFETLVSGACDGECKAQMKTSVDYLLSNSASTLSAEDKVFLQSISKKFGSSGATSLYDILGVTRDVTNSQVHQRVTRLQSLFARDVATVNVLKNIGDILGCELGRAAYDVIVSGDPATRQRNLVALIPPEAQVDAIHRVVTNTGDASRFLDTQFASRGVWRKVADSYNTLQTATEALKPLARNSQPGVFKSFLQSINDFFTSVFGGGKAGVVASQVSRQVDALEQELFTTNADGRLVLKEGKAITSDTARKISEQLSALQNVLGILSRDYNILKPEDVQDVRDKIAKLQITLGGHI